VPRPPKTGRQYARAVSAGRLVAGPGVRAACARSLRDHETAHRRGFYFDELAARRVCDFFPEFLVHSKGEWSGQRLELAAWQRFILEELYGWHRTDGTRRYRTAYICVGKKNGKSTMGAGIGLYALIADREPGAEIYSAATTRDQAKIVFLEAQRMVQKSPYLSRLVRSLRGNLHIPDTAAKFEPLSSDYNSLDGLNVYLAIVDELHAHPSGELWGTLETATAARRSPLVIAITTAGREKVSFCGEMHDQAEAIATGALQNDAFFAYVAQPDEGDDWATPTAWKKANPNLGVSVKRDALRVQAVDAQQNPAKQTTFRRFRANQWVATEAHYLDLKQWDACRGKLSLAELEAACAGRTGYAAMDLAATTDLAALVAVFPPEEPSGPFDVVARFFMPETRAFSAEAMRRDRVAYADWVNAGLLIATPGAVIDYGFIRAEIEALDDLATLAQIGYDPYNATHFVGELEELGYCMVVQRQGVASMSAPTKRLPELILGQRLRHGGHPILRWMAHNLAVAEDSKGNRIPDKRKSRQRIDGMVALIMALDRAERNEGGPEPPSVYADHDMAFL
jgi:phage terminase large subunit-like protein